MSDRRIKINWAVSRFILNRIDGIRVRIEAECAQDMPTSIFAYRNLPVDPATGSQAGWFSHVCSPVDLEEFPENAPIPTHHPQWFRLSYVDVLLRSRVEANAFIEDVCDDVRRLQHTLTIMDTIEPEGSEEIGGAVTCETSSSNSSDSSDSSDSSSSD